jgi:hypothetical protein
LEGKKPVAAVLSAKLDKAFGIGTARKLPLNIIKRWRIQVWQTQLRA